MTYDLSKFSDQEILAKTAWGENRGGGNDGMQSVINVIVNRAKTPCWWGTSIRSVCIKPMQFDCWNDNDPNLEKLIAVNINDGAYATAIDLSIQAIAGKLPDITNGACYYFAKSMNPWPLWARGKLPCADIANQLFFNNVK